MNAPLLDKLKFDLTRSLKAGDQVRLGTMRFLLAAVRNLAIDKYGAAGEASLTDADVLDVIKKQAKTHKESVEAFSKAGRSDLVDKEQAELSILQSFLPSEMSDADIRAILDPIAATGGSNFGLLMKQAMSVVSGRADGKRVSDILKSLLSN